jgi:hypothetical protein
MKLRSRPQTCAAENTTAQRTAKLRSSKHNRAADRKPAQQ